MNRIVIIGNGFDLAHGLLSRYEDFLLYLLNNAIDELNTFQISSDLYKNLFSLIRQPQNNNTIDKITTLDEVHANIRIRKQTNYTFLSDKYIESENWVTSELYAIRFNSKLFHDLFAKENWTDVEKTYFDLLLQIFKNYKEKTASSVDLNELNSDFEEIKRLFIEYITTVNSKPRNFDSQLRNNLYKCLHHDNIYDYVHSSDRANQILNQFETSELEKITIVNFNYTHSIHFYVRDFSNSLDLIHIHGRIDKPDSIVFGYGDEMTEYYKQLENLDDDSVLKHFKTHYYHSNNSYAKLLYEVENHEFDVVIFGHSLGLSDRLLLNTVFENSNCKAIHLYHSGSENHFKKRIALSRHFDNKKAFRKKLVEELDYLKIEKKK
jgi:hypothetical protein